MTTKYPCTYTFDLSKRKKKWKSGSFGYSQPSKSFSLFSANSELLNVSKTITPIEPDEKISFPDSFLDGNPFHFLDCLVVLESPQLITSPPPLAAKKFSQRGKNRAVQFRKPIRKKRLSENPHTDLRLQKQKVNDSSSLVQFNQNPRSIRKKRISSDFRGIPDPPQTNYTRIQSIHDEIGSFVPGIHLKSKNTIEITIQEFGPIIPYLSNELVPIISVSPIVNKRALSMVAEPSSNLR